MPRPITRITSALTAAILGISLAWGSTVPAQAEDDTGRAPTPSSSAATSPAVEESPPPTAEAVEPAAPTLAAPARVQLPAEDETRPATAESGKRTASSPPAPRFSQGERTRVGRIGTAADEDPEAAESIFGWVWDLYSYDMTPGIQVRVVNESGTDVHTTVTDEWGFYSLSGLAPDVYYVEFSGEGFFSTWWNNLGESESALPITVSADGEAFEADAGLDRRGTITVTVTTAARKAVLGRLIRLEHWLADEGRWQEVAADPTDSSGKVTFTNLLPGSYYVNDSDVRSGWRMATEGRYVSLWSYYRTTNGGLLEPFISGQPGTGITQTAKQGSGKWKKTSFSYRWLRDGATIPNATRSTYTPGAADIDKQLEVRITSKQGNYSFAVTSPTSWPILRTSAPTLTGAVAAGSRLTVATGQWQDAMTFSYAWYADGKRISGASGESYVLTSSQKGKRITVRVVGQFRQYPAVARTSAATGKVATAGTPTVSGARVVGSILKAKPGTWTKKTKHSYQWLRDGAAISKATKSTYRLTGADAGKLVTVRVTGRRSGYATVTRTSTTTVRVIAAGTPSIAGAAGTGFTLTARTGAWTSGASFSYQWYADGKAISGATAATLGLTGSQKGKKITVKVTGRLAGHTTASKVSKATAKVMAVGAVTSGGTMVVGSTLTARRGTWTTKTKFSYQWLREGVSIPRATRTAYRLTAADAGKSITVKVTGKRSGYATVAKASTTTVKVMAAGIPSITGTPVLGSTLTATPGDWTPGTGFLYQWFADGRAIEGATSESFVVTADQTGRRITVRVTGSQAGYPTVVRISAATALVR